MSQGQNKYPQTLAFYKPNKQGKGGAFQFKPSTYVISDEEVKHSIFIEAASQNGAGEKDFDWKNKSKMKLGLNDIGQIKAVLERRESEVSLFHKSKSGISTLKLTEQPVDRTGYYLSISNKPNSGDSTNVSIPLTTGDASNLLDALRHAVIKILNWSVQPNANNDSKVSSDTPF